jgi:hypothetical protein
MQPITTETRNVGGKATVDTKTTIERAKQQLIDQAKKAEQAQKEYETLLKQQQAADPATEEDEPREKFYNLDQLQIALCCETMLNILEGIPKPSLAATRLEQARIYLLYLGNMEEFLPPRQPPAGQRDAAAEQPIGQEDFFEEEPAIPDEDRFGEIRDPLAMDTQDKGLDEITAKLKALDDNTVMKKPEEPKPESAINRFIHKFKPKEPEPKTVSAEHQPISLG